uniref:Crp family transcriptional regulator n=2 Tax=Candidatus Bipolaricaulota TaxID=67810 RepID=H5SHB4_9BACT|nr:Crp family transcriptional regulator [uncultured Acetothermia bacterium]BAL58955.1 Crp/FNR family transcriptional regulator [Candidatus Acetothermum autotrophicum]
MAAGLPKTNKTVCEAPNSWFLNCLSPEERSQLHALMQHRAYERGETIFSQGDIISGYWVLGQGKVQLIHRTSDGHKQTVELLRDGDWFGEDGFAQASASSVSAQTLAESVIGWLSLADMQDLLRRSQALALEFMRRLSHEVSKLRVRLVELAHLGTRERLIKLLLELGEKYGFKNEHGLVIDIKLTEQDLADMLGNTRVWICRQVSMLRDRGLIAYRRGQLVILDEEKLREFAPPPRKRRAIFSFWRDLAKMCKALYTLSVNKFIDRGGDSTYTGLGGDCQCCKSQRVSGTSGSVGGRF